MKIIRITQSLQEFDSLDEEYLLLAKDPVANKSRLQSLIDEAANKSGYNIGPVWRGDSGKKRTNILDPKRSKDAYDNGPATLFSTNKKLADFYDEHDDARPFYLKSISLLSRNVGEGYRGGHWSSIGSVVSEAVNNGYDSVLVEDVTDGPGIRGNIYGVLSSNQTKLATLVTYDDQGNIIPLSQRFDESNSDIRR